jgi:hypothetical protein
MQPCGKKSDDSPSRPSKEEGRSDTAARYLKEVEDAGDLVFDIWNMEGNHENFQSALQTAVASAERVSAGNQAAQDKWKAEIGCAQVYARYKMDNRMRKAEAERASALRREHAEWKATKAAEADSIREMEEKIAGLRIELQTAQTELLELAKAFQPVPAADLTDEKLASQRKAALAYTSGAEHVARISSQIKDLEGVSTAVLASSEQPVAPSTGGGKRRPKKKSKRKSKKSKRKSKKSKRKSKKSKKSKVKTGGKKNKSSPNY